MRRDNRGLSLVEIIIVVAIMSIVGGSLIIGIGLATEKPADECAAKLQSILQSSRLAGMGKLDNRVEIYVKDDGYIYVLEKVKVATGNGADDYKYQETETRISERGITIEYILADNNTPITLDKDSAPLILSFDRSSGAFKDLSLMGPGYSGKYCYKIIITKGTRVRVLTLARLTGKVTVE